jgi:hypothetical protein
MIQAAPAAGRSILPFGQGRALYKSTRPFPGLVTSTTDIPSGLKFVVMEFTLKDRSTYDYCSNLLPPAQADFIAARISLPPAVGIADPRGGEAYNALYRGTLNWNKVPFGNPLVPAAYPQPR